MAHPTFSYKRVARVSLSASTSSSTPGSRSSPGPDSVLSADFSFSSLHQPSTPTASADRRERFAGPTPDEERDRLADRRADERTDDDVAGVVHARMEGLIDSRLGIIQVRHWAVGILEPRRFQGSRDTLQDNLEMREEGWILRSSSSRHRGRTF